MALGSASKLRWRAFPSLTWRSRQPGCTSTTPELVPATSRDIPAWEEFGRPCGPRSTRLGLTSRGQTMPTLGPWGWWGWRSGGGGHLSLPRKTVQMWIEAPQPGSPFHRNRPQAPRIDPSGQHVVQPEGGRLGMKVRGCVPSLGAPPAGAGLRGLKDAWVAVPLAPCLQALALQERRLGVTASLLPLLHHRRRRPQVQQLQQKQ